MEPKITRCAIYTRKSTEHNLDLKFNSLEAQREACEAYIKSQAHEGWELIPTRFDDGGLSGGTLDRPALQRLLGAIRARQIDTVAIYKVDRLTRSLTDFAKLVEIFDKYGTSFVSITQSFNTTNSMGRLTLNVLLSFAQFEREVIGERVRDKFDASKRKGIWMGGTVPMGYVNRDKKLIVDAEEAESVRLIFNKYLELGSVGAVLQELDRIGLKTKQRRLSGGRIVGGARFGKGGLNHLLKNRCYVGEIEHRNEFHAACHEPIVAREVFEAVQVKLAENTIEKKLKFKRGRFLLAGLIFDNAGNRMGPSHTVKQGARYRYYVSRALLHWRKNEAGKVSRVSAPAIEKLVEDYLLNRFADGLQTNGPALIQTHLRRVVVTAGAISLEVALVNGAARVDPHDIETVTLPRLVSPVRHGKSPRPAIDAPSRRSRDLALTAIGKARVWIEEIVAGGTFSEIAKREGKTERQIRLLTPLAFAAPKLVETLIAGAGDMGTISHFARKVPLRWPKSTN